MQHHVKKRGARSGDRALRTALAAGAMAVLGVLGVGCAVEASPEPSTTDRPVVSAGAGACAENGIHDESLTSGLTGALGSLTGAVGLCTPLTCCFPNGGEWGSNAFENSLRALGCTTPHAYSEAAGSSMWWLYTECPASAKLTTLVAQYSKVAPYKSQFVVNACLLLDAVGSLKLGDVFVEFDPTCGSCAPARL
jgi:hypothetical protein